MRLAARTRAFLADWVPPLAGLALLAFGAWEAYQAQGCGAWKAVLAGVGLLAVRPPRRHPHPHPPREG